MFWVDGAGYHGFNVGSQQELCSFAEAQMLMECDSHSIKRLLHCCMTQLWAVGPR